MTKRNAYVRFLAGLPGFLNSPITYQEAKETVLRRMDQRNENFLRTMRLCVYGRPDSPYLPLLREARCEYGDMAEALSRGDLESLLLSLRQEGVWITFEEFKGRRPIDRLGRSYPVSDVDFDNPFLTGGYEVQTGGSSGRPSRMLLDLEFITARSHYEHFMFRLLDIYGLPLALWYPRLPVSIGLSASLRYAKIGQPAERWFDMLPGRAHAPRWHSWASSAIIALSHLSKAPLPRPVAAPMTDPKLVVDWLTGSIRRRGRCVLQSNVSGVTRICRSARSRGIDLTGAQFVTGSEALTPGKHAEISAAGARVFLRYFTVDIGSVACGCAAPSQLDEMHFLSDSVAMIPAPGDPWEGGAQSLLLTSILEHGPKVMINVELGDRAVLSRRHCGCVYEQLGFHTRLSQLRSESRSAAEGIALPYETLAQMVDQLLPQLFGGASVDFQWVEDEDANAGSLTRLWLRISPELGPLRESSVRGAVLAALEKGNMANRFFARVLEIAESIQVLREHPRTTPAGKTPALLRGRETGIPV